MAKRQFEEATARYRTIQKIAISAGGLRASVQRPVRFCLDPIPRTPTGWRALAGRRRCRQSQRRHQLRAGDSTSLMAHLKAMQGGLTDVVKRVQKQFSVAASSRSPVATVMSVRTEQQASALQETAASIQERLPLWRAMPTAHYRRTSWPVCGVGAGGPGWRCRRRSDDHEGDQRQQQEDLRHHRLIDGIAFQTNILALNAAVEAARAVNKDEASRSLPAKCAAWRSAAARWFARSSHRSAPASSASTRGLHWSTRLDRP